MPMFEATYLPRVPNSICVRSVGSNNLCFNTVGANTELEPLRVQWEQLRFVRTLARYLLLPMNMDPRCEIDRLRDTWLFGILRQHPLYRADPMVSCVLFFLF